MTSPLAGSPAWLDLALEAPIDPDRPIIDPHHHLWPAVGGRSRYLLADLWSDTGAGHHIVKTVFIECRASYREDGPEHLKPIGETDFVARLARASRDGGGGAEIAGIVSHADLRGGALLVEALAAHEAAGGGLFRGIRHSGARDPQNFWGRDFFPRNFADLTIKSLIIGTGLHHYRHRYGMT